MRGRKFLYALILAAVGAVVFSVAAYAETTEDGLYTYEILEEKGVQYAEISTYNGEIGGDLTLPDYLGGYPVMSLATYFLNFDRDTTHIGTLTFPRYLGNLEITTLLTWTEKFVISEENEWFCTDEAGAFWDKDKTVLYAYPVFGAEKEYRIPDTLQYDVLYSMFYSNKNLERVYIPGGLKKLGGTCFTFAERLREVFLGEGVEAIGNNCTGVCPAMERFVLPSTLKTIEYNGLSGLANLKELVIPASVTTIGNGAFSDNAKMERIVFLGLPEAINDPSYYRVISADPSLTDVYFAASEEAFNDAAITLRIPDGVQMHFNADYVTANDVKIDYNDALLALDGGMLNGGGADSLFAWDFYADEFEMISLGRDVKKVGAYAFHDFQELSEVVIYGDGVTVEKNAFVGCDKLRTIIAFGALTLEDGAVPEGVVVLVPAEAAGAVNGAATVKYAHAAGELSLTGDLRIDAYAFLDAASVLGDRLGAIHKIKATSLCIENVPIYYYDETGGKVRLEDNTLVNGVIAAAVADADGNVTEISFNALCEGIANRTISSFFFVTADEPHGEHIDTPVSVSFSDRIITGIRKILKAITTLLNALFRFLKSLGR